MQKNCKFRIYQHLQIPHADPDHLFLAIAQNWAMQLLVGFVMQGHIIVDIISLKLCTIFLFKVVLVLLLYNTHKFSSFE